MVIIFKMKNNKDLKDCRFARENITVENTVAVFQNVKQELPQNPAILLLGVHPKELKRGTQM